MRILFILLVCITTTLATDVLLDSCRRVFATSDGSFLSMLHDDIVLHLTNQLKKIVGINPQFEWSLEEVRNLPDDKLTELMLLALMGNYTTAATSSWQQPCRIMINPQTGLFQLQDDRSIADEILSVLLIIMCIIQLKQLLEAT